MYCHFIHRQGNLLSLFQVAKIALAFKRVTFILPILLCFCLVTEHYIYEYICFIDLSTVVFKRARSFFRDKMKIKYRPFLSVAAQALYLYLRVISFVIHSYSVVFLSWWRFFVVAQPKNNKNFMRANASLVFRYTTNEPTVKVNFQLLADRYTQCCSLIVNRIVNCAFSLRVPTSYTNKLKLKKVFIEEKGSTLTQLVWNTSMAAVSLFWDTNMALVTSCM